MRALTLSYVTLSLSPNRELGWRRVPHLEGGTDKVKVRRKSIPETEEAARANVQRRVQGGVWEAGIGGLISITLLNPTTALCQESEAGGLLQD